jgi:hypothetical protein|nr:MAG TPA: hypothetical protein [Caudoviricetes sp.]
MIDKSKLCLYKQYYMTGEVLSLPNSDYMLVRVSGRMPSPIMLYGLDNICIGVYAILNAETGRVVCTREIYDHDLKVLGYDENALSGNINDMLHYNGGARLTEYMNRIRRRRLNTR